MVDAKTYLNNNARSDTTFFRPDLLGESNAFASVPLIVHEQVIGALWIARQTDFNGAGSTLLNAIADIAANAIHRVTLFEQTEQPLTMIALSSDRRCHYHQL